MHGTSEGISTGRRLNWTPRIGGLAWRAAVVLFVLAAPAFLVTSNLRLAFNSLGLYTYGFERFHISQATGIPPQELRRVAREIIWYWNSEDEWLDIKVSGQPLYNTREVVHLRDVKGLVQGVFRTQEVTGGWLLAFVLGGLLLRRRAFLEPLAGSLRWGGLLTLGLVVVSGIALAAAFPWLFYLFHILSFANDFWQLDPRTDYLVRMFPQGFWFMATMLVVALTVLEAAAVAVGSWLALRFLRRRGRAAAG